jgi:hypothetical protein
MTISALNKQGKGGASYENNGDNWCAAGSVPRPCYRPAATNVLIAFRGGKPQVCIHHFPFIPQSPAATIWAAMESRPATPAQSSNLPVALPYAALHGAGNDALCRNSWVGFSFLGQCVEEGCRNSGLNLETAFCLFHPGHGATVCLDGRSDLSILQAIHVGSDNRLPQPRRCINVDYAHLRHGIFPADHDRSCVIRVTFTRYARHLAPLVVVRRCSHPHSVESTQLHRAAA